jgi:hypothetical protein
VDGLEDVAGMDLVAGSGGQGHCRREAGLSVPGARRTVDAFTASARQRGQQAGGLAGEIPYPRRSTVQAETARME